MIPRKGCAIVTPIRTAESRGKIVLLGATRERWSAWQANLVRLGEPPECVSPKCRDEPHTHGLDLPPGSWVVLQPRMAIDLDDSLKIVNQTDILAVLA